MPKSETTRFKVSFTLDEEDAEYFRSRYRQAESVATKKDATEIIKRGRAVVDEARASSKTPSFVLHAIATLEDLIRIVEDDRYQAPPEVKQEVLAGIAYFSDPHDLIPDEVPGLGFLDDAIMIRFIAHENRHELRGYGNFAAAVGDAGREPGKPHNYVVPEEKVAEIRSSVRAQIGKWTRQEENKRPWIDW